MRSTVVLPQPDGPSIEKNSPRWTSKRASATATNSPKRLLTPSTAITTGVAPSPAAATCAAPDTRGLLSDRFRACKARSARAGRGRLAIARLARRRRAFPGDVLVAAAVNVGNAGLEPAREARQFVVEPA